MEITTQLQHLASEIANAKGAIILYDEMDTLAPGCQDLAEDLQALHTYLGLRESAKHYLMQGYALIRRILLELDRRFRLGRFRECRRRSRPGDRRCADPWRGRAQDRDARHGLEDEERRGDRRCGHRPGRMY